MPLKKRKDLDKSNSNPRIGVRVMFSFFMSAQEKPPIL